MTTDLVRCRFCGEPFDGGPCTKCGAHVEKWSANHRMCPDCATKAWAAANEGRYERYLDEATTKYNNWLELIKTASSIRLSEEDWIAACKYFGGCAICGSEHIDTRAFFIKFKYGGRYAAWNIIPVCTKCNTTYKRQPNPFIYLDPNAGNGTSESKKNLQSIVDYLSERMQR